VTQGGSGSQDALSLGQDQFTGGCAKD